MSKNYKLSIRWNNSTTPQDIPFVVPESAGTYLMTIKLTDGTEVSKNIIVDSTERTYTISGRLTNGNAFSGSFVTKQTGISIDIVFPRVGDEITNFVTYTEDGVVYYSYSASKTSTYSDYSAYTSCTIDGIDVGSSYTKIKETVREMLSGNMATTTYSARFVNGVLTTRTMYTLRKTEIGTVSALGNSYYTTAEFGGKIPQLQLDAGDFQDCCWHSATNSIHLYGFNNNNTAATLNYTVYDSNNVNYASGSFEVGANAIIDEEIALDSSYTLGYVIFQMTATGWLPSAEANRTVSEEQQ